MRTALRPMSLRILAKRAVIEIVVARLPVLVADGPGNPVDQFGAPVIEDDYDMNDSRLLASGANGHAELDAGKHFAQATIPLPLLQSEVEVFVEAIVVDNCAHVDAMCLQTAKQHINMAFVAIGKLLLAFVLCSSACSRMDMQVDSGRFRDYTVQLHLLCCPGDSQISQHRFCMPHCPL